MTNNIIQFPYLRNLDLNRTYTLLWTWENNYFNNPTSISFTGHQLLNAYNDLPQVIRTCPKLLNQLKSRLHDWMRIAGRTAQGLPLQNEACPALASWCKNANSGCAEAQAFMHRQMALFLALSLDEIAANELELIEELCAAGCELTAEDVRKNNGFIWINDTDDDQLDCA